MAYADITSGIQSEPKQKPKSAAARFKELDSKRDSMLQRCQDYAMWTLPYIFPERHSTNTESAERPGPIDATGAQAVNQLSNKLVMTLFQLSGPFFRLMVQDDTMQKLKKDAKEGDKDAQLVLETMDEALSINEKKAMRELDYTHYRTEATTAAKALIITGNSMLYHPDGMKGKVQCYSVKDYVVKRDLNGEVVEFLTRDKKALETFSPHVQEQIMASKDGKQKHSGSDVCLYTWVKLQRDGRFVMKQSADEVQLDSEGTWPKDELPWIILTWNLVRGEDYGRGLVEDYAGAFHGLHVLSGAFVDAVGAAADIKWLVNPASVLDVATLNNSESGTYHSGQEGDITCVQVNKAMDLAMVKEMIQEWRTQIGKAFLMFSSVQRQAERVTAEEIRAIINDLDSANGGIYSRFASEWQYPTAKLMLKRIKVTIGDGRVIYPQIVTGLDSLSRSGDMDNFRLFMQDLAFTKELPDPVLGALDMLKVAKYCGVRRGIDPELLLKTAEQAQAEAQAQQQMLQQQQAIATEGKVAEAAGKAAFEG